MKHLSKLSICLLILLTYFSHIYSAWLNDVPHNLTQPDGTVINVLTTGDEFHHWPHNENGFTIIQDAVTGFWCWAKAENGDLISTGYPIHLHSPESLGLSPKENISNERYQQLRDDFNSHNQARGNLRAPTLGIVNNIVVFIRFSTDSEFTSPKSEYDDMLNGQGVNVNSMYQYFWDASYNQLQVVSPMYPIATGNTIVSYQSPHPRNYFQPYNSVTNPNGYEGGSNGQERAEREHALLRDAIEYIHNQIPVDMVIDSDNDGFVDNVCFIIRGGTGAWADLLWPHRWSLYTYDVYLHGKQVYVYNFNIESMTYNSVLVHEFSHSFGIPDFYRYYNNDITPIGFWDVMAQDLNPPQSISAWTRFNYTGWVYEMPVITTNGTYTLYPTTTSPENHAYRINSPNSNTEFFVVEYRSNNTGYIDSNLPGSGLLVYRVNSQESGNSMGPPDELYVYRAWGTLVSDGQIGSAFFSSDLNRTAITDLTNPSSFLSDGQAGGLFIYNIGSAGESISFDVIVGGANPNDFNESFENQAFTNFDWINDPVAPWVISNEHASNGTYSAASGDIGHNQSSVLELNMNCDFGYIQFMLKTSTQSGGDFLRFYINNSEIKSWSGNTDWVHFSMPLLEGLYNFKWVYQKNSSVVFGSDKVWIDQIGFPELKGHILYPISDLSHTLDERKITFNWNIPFQTQMANPPTLLGYNIYQNDVKINNSPIPENTFLYLHPSGGNMRFRVSAEYSEGESDLSDPISIQLPFLPPYNLTATNEGNGIRLSWEYYPVQSFLFGFRVLRDEINITPQLLSPETFTFYDNNLTTGQNYLYKVLALLMNPYGVSPTSNEVEIIFTNTLDDNEPVVITQLKGNYPNPFNPETTISFDISTDSNVQINIYNIRGQKVKALVDDFYSSGSYSIIWQGTDDKDNTLPSGIYFYRMQANEFTATKRMLMLK